MPISHLALASVLILVWGFNFVVVKVGLEGLPPLFLCFSRFFLTSLPWIFFVRRPRAPFRLVLLYGLIMFALQFSLLFFGVFAGVTAALASILLQVQVFFSILLAIPFLGERLHRWQVIGALVSFTGIGVVGVNSRGEVSLLGLTLVLFAAFFWGVGSVISKKLGKINMAALVIWGSLIAWPPVLAASLLIEGKEVVYALRHLSLTGLSSVLYITYFSTLFGFGAWNWLLSHHPVSKVTPFTLLIPIVGALSAALVLDEPLQGWKIGAGLLVVSGLCLHLLGPRMDRKMREWSVSESNR